MQALLKSCALVLTLGLSATSLQAAEKVIFDASVYRRIVAQKGVIPDLYKAVLGPELDKDPKHHSFTWDSLPALFLVHPELVTESKDLWVDVDPHFGPVTAAPWATKKGAPLGTQKARVVYAVDQKKFWDEYVNLVTLPAPVRH